MCEFFEGERLVIDCVLEESGVGKVGVCVRGGLKVVGPRGALCVRRCLGGEACAGRLSFRSFIFFELPT